MQLADQTDTMQNWKQLHHQTRMPEHYRCQLAANSITCQLLYFSVLFAEPFSFPSAHSKPKHRMAKRCCLQRLQVPHCVPTGRHSRHYFHRHHQRT